MRGVSQGRIFPVGGQNELDDIFGILLFGRGRMWIVGRMPTIPEAEAVCRIALRFGVYSSGVNRHHLRSAWPAVRLSPSLRHFTIFQSNFQWGLLLPFPLLLSSVDTIPCLLSVSNEMRVRQHGYLLQSPAVIFWCKVCSSQSILCKCIS